jgi:hypothetical protein
MKRIFGTVLAVAVLAGSAAVALAVSSGVTNGGFETGSLAPWTPSNEGSTEWQVSDGTGLSTSCAIVLPGPHTGQFDAIENQGGGSGSGFLYQDMVVPADATTLTFALTWANGSSGWSMPSGHPFDGQFLSVDVLKLPSDPESFAPSDVIATPIRMSSGSANLVGPWQTFSVPLASHAGQTVRLRFAAAGQFGCMSVGVDDVSFLQNAAAPQDERAAYCSVAGDTWPDGTAIPPGTFLNLEAGQPSTGSAYAGAVPANYVAGVGLTCDPPPAGDTQEGTAGAAQHVAGGIYPYYAPPS